MRDAFILLSPKSNGVSSQLLAEIQQKLAKSAETTDFYFCKTDCEVPDFSRYDRIIIAAPVYINALPADAIAFLEAAEKANLHKSVPKVYFLSNCGFPEEENNKINTSQIRFWCTRCGFQYGYSVCFGSGIRLFADAVEQQPVGIQQKIWNVFIGFCRRLASYDFIVFHKNFSEEGYVHTIEKLIRDIENGNDGPDIFLHPYIPKSVLVSNIITNLLFYFKTVLDQHTSSSDRAV